MSLVVSKIIDNKIEIESDSRITDINEAKKESIYGVLKSIIVYPQLCISFAGSIYLAEKAIKEIYDNEIITFPHLIETLLRYNSDENRVEFIMSSLKNNKPIIIKISNKKVEAGLTSAWIGDLDGFNDFQKNFHELKSSGKSDKDSFTNAFSKVVENPNIPTVGDFQVSTITEIGTHGEFFFRYFEKFMLILGEPQTFTVSGGKETRMTMSWGTAAGGSFGFCYFVSVTPFKNAIAYYFVHGNFGVLFYPKLSFQGIVIKNKSNMEFLEYINEKYQ